MLSCMSAVLSIFFREFVIACVLLAFNCLKKSPNLCLNRVVFVSNQSGRHRPLPQRLPVQL